MQTASRIGTRTICGCAVMLLLLGGIATGCRQNAASPSPDVSPLETPLPAPTALPVTASAAALSGVVSGAAQTLDSGTIRRNAACLLATTTTISFVGNAGDVTNTWQTWNTNDFLQWCIEYEPA